MMPEKPKNQHKNNKWMVLITIPFQMLVTIGIGYFLGNKADVYLQNNKGYGALVGTLTGVGLSLYYTLSMLKKINNQKD